MFTLLSNAYNYIALVTGESSLFLVESLFVSCQSFFFSTRYSELHRCRRRFVVVDDMATLAAHSYVPVALHHRSAVLYYRRHSIRVQTSQVCNFFI